MTLWKVSVTPDKPDASCTFNNERAGSSLTADRRFSFSIIHSYLNKRNCPAHFTKEDKHTLRIRTQTLLVLMIESCIASAGPQASKSLQLSIVITVTDCLLGICCRTRLFYVEKAGGGRSWAEEANSCYNTCTLESTGPWTLCIQSITDLGRARKYVSPWLVWVHHAYCQYLQIVWTY